MILPFKSINPEFNEYLQLYFDQISKEKELKVLIVDDDLLNRRYMEYIFSSTFPKAIIHTASSCEEARALTHGVAYDFAILDYFLEEKETGLELCRDLHDAFPRIQFILTSALKHQQFLNLASTKYFIPPFIEKPLSLDKLRQVVQL